MCVWQKIWVLQLIDLAACALLHDNALLQYIQEEFRKGAEEQTDKSMTPKQVAMHCVYGEKNLKNYPFHTDVTNVILYHHENADGSGRSGKHGKKHHYLPG